MLTPENAIGLFSILLVPFALGGLALIGTGLNHSRSAAHSVIASLSAAAVAFLAYFVCGFAVQAAPGHSLVIAGKAWDWIGAGPLFLRGAPTSLVLPLQMFSVAMAAMIPVASGAERWRLGAVCASSAILAGCTYPLFAHWVWGGGWLAHFGFLDPGGASCIHAVGGLTALSTAWILGPRRGKFTADGMPTAMPGHNAVIVLFGCILMLIGSLGLNSAGALSLAGEKHLDLTAVVVNTLLSAASGLLAAIAVTRIRFGKPDASLSANGWVGGLVASAAVSAFVQPAEAVVIGSIAGALIIYGIEIVELKMHVDDPAGAISVHGLGGIWGVLAAGIFSGDASQFLVQLAGIATLAGFVLPLTYGLNRLLDRFVRQRVDAEGERQGMDLFELGAGAYPDFVTHRDDFLRW